MSDTETRLPEALHDAILAMLREQGIDLDELCDSGNGEPAVRVIRVSPSLQSSREEFRGLPRGETVMVRTDEATRQTLDAWVETGYFKSRSEAAALFLKEGLKMRQRELDSLIDAIDGVKQAREELRAKAQEIFGAEE